MKKLLIKSIGLLMIMGFFIISCNPEEDDRNLTGKLDASEIDFQVIQDFDLDSGGNTIILINNTPETISVWDYGTGKSNKKIDTIRFAFQGDYVIKRTAITEGGQVELEPITVTVTDDNLNYVNDPLWTNLSGGVGNSKAWVADNGNYGFAPGALAYADPSTTVEFNNFTPNWEPEGLPPGSTDENMNWGNYMTFSLEGGPFMTVHDGDDNLLETGTYFLDKDAKTLTTNGAFILRPENYIANASNWNNNVKILTLTGNQLRIAIMRTNDEGPWYYILNYVAKDYADSYVPADVPDPTPPIDLNGGTAGDLISVTTTESKTWSLSPDTPFNWTDLDGNFLNEWSSVDDYVNSGWAGYGPEDQDDMINSKIIFSADGTVKTIDPDGNEMDGSYTVSEGTNVISFSGITPSFPMGDWAVATTTSQNEWKIVKTGLTGSTVTDIWFGKRDETPGKNEYMVFHFVLNDASFDPIEENRKLIINSLAGGQSSSRTFKVSDTWHVDWLAGDLTGGWTSATTFADDFTSNSWVWTEAVKAGLQDPTLTFTSDGAGGLTATKVQDGVTTTADVNIDAENNIIEIDMDLIAFTDAASWLPTYGPEWYICKVPLSAIETDGLWLGKMGVNGDGDPEVIAIHYVIAE